MFDVDANTDVTAFDLYKVWRACTNGPPSENKTHAPAKARRNHRHHRVPAIYRVYTAWIRRRTGDAADYPFAVEKQKFSQKQWSPIVLLYVPCQVRHCSVIEMVFADKSTHGLKHLQDVGPSFHLRQGTKHGVGAPIVGWRECCKLRRINNNPPLAAKARNLQSGRRS